MSGWIGVDLDGTIAEYGGWQGADHIGAPIPAMVERVRQWLIELRTVKIFTARVWSDGSPQMEADRERMVSQIQDWTEKHVGARLPVTCQKDYGMVELWDDRAVQVIPNTGRRADGN